MVMAQAVTYYSQRSYKMTVKYEIKETDSGEIVIRYNEDGSVSSFMKDLANSDYQRYLEDEAEAK
jgi:hypothetical protein